MMNETEIQPEDARGGTLPVTLRLLRRFLPGETHGLIGGLFLLLVGSGVTLLQPWPLKLVLDSVVGQAPLPAVVHRLIAPFAGLSPFAASPKLFLLTIFCLALLLVELVMGVCNVWSAYVLN